LTGTRYQIQKPSLGLNSKVGSRPLSLLIYSSSTKPRCYTPPINITVVIPAIASPDNKTRSLAIRQRACQ